MAEIAEKQMLPVGTVLNGKYRVVKYLSSGGFGNTYVAFDMAFQCEVAIKEFYMQGDTHRAADRMTVSVSNPGKQGLFEAQRAKFKKEAQRIRQLSSPQIIRVTDLFDTNGTSYYVMDLVKGESLSDVLKRTGRPFSEQEALRIVGQLLDALNVVHGEGLFHLDIKPSNVMLNAHGNVVLIDFGASKLIGEHGGVTASSALCYTPGYAPAEQMDQKPDRIGAWTDVYAVGATLYKMVTNNQPPLPSEILDDGESAFRFPPSVSTGMRQLIVRLMQPRQKDRPQTVAAVRALMSGAAGQPHQGTTTHYLQDTSGTGQSLREDIGRSECVYGGPNNMKWVREKLRATTQKQDRFGFLKFFGHSLLRLAFYGLCVFMLYSLVSYMIPIKEHWTEIGDDGIKLWIVKFYDGLQMYRGSQDGMGYPLVEDAALSEYQGEAIWGVVLPIPLICLLGSILLGIRKKRRQPGTRFFSYAGMTFCRSLFVFCAVFSLYSFIAWMTPKTYSFEGSSEVEYRVTDMTNMYYSESWRRDSNAEYAKNKYQGKALAGTIVPLPFAFITGLVLLYQRKKKKRAVT